MKKREYVASIIGNIIILVILNLLPRFHLSFISEGYFSVLWVFNVIIPLQILGYILLLLYNPLWFQHIIKFLQNLLGVIGTFVLIKIFPFNFWGISLLNIIVRIVFILVLVVTAISCIVSLIKFLSGSNITSG